MEEYEEFNKSLKELQTKIFGSISIALEARDKMSKLINESHLKSTLTLLKDDIVLRRMLNLK